MRQFLTTPEPLLEKEGSFFFSASFDFLCLKAYRFLLAEKLKGSSAAAPLLTKVGFGGG